MAFFSLGDMNLMIMQRLIEKLRPLVDLEGWDCCVVWKLSEDQRYIEWVGCSCGGICNTQNASEETRFSVSPCRDSLLPHTRTRACVLLSQLPSIIPLDSGIYAQTIISNQANWINYSNSSDASILEEAMGTKVLVPVPGGLVELFVNKQVSEDKNVLEFITNQYNILMCQEVLVSSNTIDVNSMINAQSYQITVDEHESKDQNNQLQQPSVSSTAASENLSMADEISLDRINLCNSRANFVTHDNRMKTDSLFDGLYDSFLMDKQINQNKSTAENEIQDMEALHKCMMTDTQLLEPMENNDLQGDDRDPMRQEMGQSGSISDCSDQIDDEDDVKYRPRNGKGPQSKNLVAERNRRKKLNERLYILRSLVPNISKLDRASILGDAIEYVEKLKKQVKDLEEELEEHSDNSSANKNNRNQDSHINVQSDTPSVRARAEHDHMKPNEFHAITTSGNGKKTHDSENLSKTQQMEPQVEVRLIDGNKFFVKVFCEHKPGGFVRLMEAFDSLGMEITNANVNSHTGLVSNVFEVEKKDCEMIQVEDVRDSLLEITRNPCRGWTMTAQASENGSSMDYQYHHHNHHFSSYHHHQ